MLIEQNSHLYTYAITRDYGFAPNPFLGYCTLATCKPRIRKSACIGDWIMGIGGSDLKKVKGKCIYLMKVSEKMNFNEYWQDPRFSLKKPARNGSRLRMVGDNIYHRDQSGIWIQEDSHHSQADGTVNQDNLERDTGSCELVVISECFYYFGDLAVDIDLDAIGYKKIRDYKKTDLTNNEEARSLVLSITENYKSDRNSIISNPVQFIESHKRVDQLTGKVV